MTAVNCGHLVECRLCGAECAGSPQWIDRCDGLAGLDCPNRSGRCPCQQLCRTCLDLAWLVASSRLKRRGLPSQGELTARRSG